MRRVSALRLVALCAPAALAATAVALPSHAAAATTTFTVTTNADPASGTACPATTDPCSLRTAIADAATAGGTVVIDVAVDGPFVLAQGSLNVTGGETLTIQGESNGSTVIDGNNGRAIWESNLGATSPTACGTSPTTLTLDHVTLTNGNAAGAPSNDGFGGGLDVDCASSLTMVDSAITKSTSQSGGGGLNDNTTGAVVLDRTTLSGNTVTGTVPAVDGGGGVQVSTGANFTALDTTIAGNTAPGGGGGVLTVTGSTVKLVNDTIAGNTATAPLAGGVLVAANVSATATNTIVATNGTNCQVRGTMTDGGHNLEDGTSCGFSSSAVNADPKLTALGDNGGPTQTMLLNPGSPAIDAGDDTACAAASPNGAAGLDQRGVSRPQGGHCDIGAAEDVATTTTLRAAQDASATNVTLTATVTRSMSIGPDAAGTVEFTKGTTSLGSAALSAGTASVAVPIATAADPTFTATFRPSSPVLGSSGSVAFTPTPPVPATGGGMPAGAWLPAAAVGSAGGVFLLAGLSPDRRRRRRRR